MTNSNDLGAVSNTINAHAANKSNPHGVTKAQVGLGSVANLDQSKAIKSITRSGTTFTYTALDGTTSTFTQQDTDTTYSVFTGATASSGGSTGLVPKPTIEDVDKYLCSDGTWKTASGGTSDAPVRVSGSVYNNNITHGTITAYRIGHLLYIFAAGLDVELSARSPMTPIFVLDIIDGFSIKDGATSWVSFSIADGMPDDYGIAVISSDRTIMLMGRSGYSEKGIYFSLIVPLIDT